MIARVRGATVRESDRRALADLVLMRAEWLARPDRALLEQVLGRGVLPREVAAVAGVSTRTIQRRVRQLARRLTGRQVEHILRAHQHWDRTTAAVALAVWVRGMGWRQAAEELGMTLHALRQHIQIVKGLLQAAEFKSDAMR